MGRGLFFGKLGDIPDQRRNIFFLINLVGWDLLGCGGQQGAGEKEVEKHGGRRNACGVRCGVCLYFFQKRADIARRTPQIEKTM